MLKRKEIEQFDINQASSINSNNFDLQYINPVNCDKIKLKNRDIYFTCIISDDSINKLIEYIIYIKQKNPSDLNTIFIHITSKGGYVSSLLTFLNFKQTSNFHLTSIIVDHCNDAAIILSSMCDYRIITKNSVCNLSKYDYINYKNYWGYFKQCELDETSTSYLKNLIYDLFLKFIKTKLNNEKLNAYLIYSSNNNFNSKKCKKLGIIDEIV